ncbi:MAG: hypothetical protein IT198_04760 [Acidimicrobiia bacterium]|nr:hypothetical protein [Acidimicrobiia bacterium]
MRKRFRYSAWDGTQVVDLDADDVLGEMADDLITHGDLSAALRRLLQQGMGDDVQGLREMIESLRERRRELLSQYDPSGVLEDIQERLDDVVRTEEGTLEGDARVAEGREDERSRSESLERMERLHRLPDDAGARIRELRDYDFRDAEAARKFEELMDDLRRQMMERFSSQLTQGLRDMSPEQMQRMKDMMAELNRMLRERAEGREPDFDAFMDQYGDFFPENPQNLDELLEQIARRMLATAQLLASMSEEQRAELQSVLDSMMEDMDLRWQADELGRLLADAFPSLPWDQGFDFTGSDPLDMSGGMSLMDVLGRMDDLDGFMSQATSPAMLAEIDPDEVRDLVGEDAARSLRRLQQITQRLEDAGLIENREGRLELTPRGMRKIGQKTLGELFRGLALDRLGEHEMAKRGALGEPTYQTRPYVFGDPFLLDVGRTIRNAITRSGPGTPVRVLPEDFEIEETERLTRTSTVLMLDLSLSMPMRDNFLAAKKVAVALHALISARFPRDYLGIVGFSEVAREIRPQDLPKASYDFVYGTNMQHAFVLAREMLAREHATTRQIVMITDGEPTAHIEDGVPVFSYPPAPRTIEETLREVVRCTREGIRINTFMLDASPALRRFVEKMTQMNSGRAFFTTPENLGTYVLVDFLEHRVEKRVS